MNGSMSRQGEERLSKADATCRWCRWVASRCRTGRKKVKRVTEIREVFVCTHVWQLRRKKAKVP